MLAHGMLMVAGGGGGALGYRDMVIADGASHAWFLDETSGSVAFDTIGAAHGNYYGSPILGKAGPANLKAIGLNGTNQFIGNQNILVQSRNFSYEVLFKTSFSGGGIFQANNTGNQTKPNVYDREFYITSTGKPICFVYNSGPIYTVVEKIIADGEWHHLVVSYGDSSTIIIIDGELSASFNGVSGVTAGCPVFGYAYLFNHPQPNGYYLAGDIAAPALYPFAMSLEMAAAHAAAALG